MASYSSVDVEKVTIDSRVVTKKRQTTRDYKRQRAYIRNARERGRATQEGPWHKTPPRARVAHTSNLYEKPIKDQRSVYRTCQKVTNTN